jgi:hypothetical protein
VVRAQHDQAVFQSMTTEHTRIRDAAHATRACHGVAAGETPVTSGALATPRPTGWTGADDTGQHGTQLVR